MTTLKIGYCTKGKGYMGYVNVSEIIKGKQLHLYTFWAENVRKSKTDAKLDGLSKAYKLINKSSRWATFYLSI